MPNKSIDPSEHERRLALYSPHKSYEEMGKEMFLAPKGVEAWIRRYGLRQPYGIKQKIQITPELSIWDYRDGTVGKNIKRRTYVKKRPKQERALINEFMSTCLELSKVGFIDLDRVIKGFRKEAKQKRRAYS